MSAYNVLYATPSTGHSRGKTKAPCPLGFKILACERWTINKISNGICSMITALGVSPGAVLWEQISRKRGRDSGVERSSSWNRSGWPHLESLGKSLKEWGAGPEPVGRASSQHRQWVRGLPGQSGKSGKAEAEPLEELSQGEVVWNEVREKRGGGEGTGARGIDHP